MAFWQKSIPESTPAVVPDPEVKLSEETLELYASARQDHANTYYENNLFRNNVQLTEKQEKKYKERHQ